MNPSYRRLIAFFVLLAVLIISASITSILPFWNTNFGALEASYAVGSKKGNGELSVAFCVLAKDELDLYEWIDYHRQLGVGKFYLLDEHSDPPLSLQIPNFIDSGLVHYEKYSYFWSNTLHFLGFATKNHLRVAFDECLRKHGDKHDWIGFFDADEFVILKVAKDVLCASSTLDILTHKFRTHSYNFEG
jgi:Glycosyl transferase family 2